MWLNSVLSFLHLEVWQQLSPSRVCPASCAAHGMLQLLLQGRICLYKTRGSAASGWSRPLTAQSVPGIVFLVRLAVNLIEWTSCLGLSLYTLHPLCFFFLFFCFMSLFFCSCLCSLLSSTELLSTQPYTCTLLLCTVYTVALKPVHL